MPVPQMAGMPIMTQPGVMQMQPVLGQQQVSKSHALPLTDKLSNTSPFCFAKYKSASIESNSFKKAN